MTAGLLGWISAVSVFVKALSVETRGRWSQAFSFSAPEQVFTRPVPNRIATRRVQGFTILEFMIAVAILGVLSAIAFPSFVEVIATQRVKTATFDFYGALTYARSEAIKRNSVVTITPRGGSFGNGYDLDAGGVILRSQNGSPAVTIAAPGGIALAFDGSGRLTSPALYTLEVSSAQSSSTPKRCLIINPTGRPSIRVDTNHDNNCING